MPPIKIIGAGLAGSEAAWQCARHGLDIELFEMRPVRSTPAHQTTDFAELVCSNSLKSDSENTAPWLLKEEMRRAGSLLLEIARDCAVPAGHALAVDRVVFAAKVTEAISREPRITVRREEVSAVDEKNGLTIIATGPLTSESLATEIARLSAPSPDPSDSTAHSPRLYFYDSISPIVEADSIDMSRVYMAARYDKGSADYINCPMTQDEYNNFLDALVAAQSVEERDWEKLNYFEGCLPIEEIARRGRDTLRFGPMKPVGLKGSAHRQDALCSRAAAAGKSARGFLQSSRISKSSEVRRAGSRAAPHTGPGKRPLLALRTDPSQHLYQRAHFAPTNSADEIAPQRIFRRPDLWRRRLCRIDRDRTLSRTSCCRSGARNAACTCPARVSLSDPSLITSPTRIPNTFSPRTSRLISSPHSIEKFATAKSVTASSATSP